MSDALLKTKLYIPPLRPGYISRPRLLKQLDQGLQPGHRLTLISAPAGFGKTTLVTEWLAAGEHRAAWLSLDREDGDPVRFFIYLIAALQAIAPSVGNGILATLQSPQPPPVDAFLTPLLNEISTIAEPFTLVLDDYHVVEAGAVDQILSFLLTHLPPQMGLFLTTREDPQLPLARLRARGQLTELRAADLRFTVDEATRFLNQMMNLDLASEAVIALEERTEGWIAGLQLAALSVRGQQDPAGFIESFTGSHRFVLDYLAEEVLQQQPAELQAFLLRTSILDRLCGPLCDAVMGQPTADGRDTLAYLEQANLFLIPLDSRRRWYRYHHLFADLLRQQLQRQLVPRHQLLPAPAGDPDLAELHIRASAWFEENDLGLEAFQHAAAANDVERAARLIQGRGMPLYYQGAAAPVVKWLDTLPRAVLDSQPSLWVAYAAALWVAGRGSAVESTLQAAETALEGAESNRESRDLLGQIAALRAGLAGPQHDTETMIAEARRALELLDPENRPVRTTATWSLALAHQFLGEREKAMAGYRDVITMSEASGNTLVAILATTGLGIIQEWQNQLQPAAATYRRVLDLGGDPAPPSLCEAHLGLARLHYQWDDFDGAEAHLDESRRMAANIETIDGTVACDVVRAQIRLAQDDLAAAETLLNEAQEAARRHNFVRQIPAVAAAQVRLLLLRGDAPAAARLADAHDLPFSRARARLAQGDGTGALAVLEPTRKEAEAKGWEDERLKALVLETVAYRILDDETRALLRLDQALTAAESGGFVRLFADEGPPMAELLAVAAGQGMAPKYTGRLLAAVDAEPTPTLSQPLLDPLSDRELEVLRLVAQGLSNRQIAERLYLALSTVKGHNRRIYAKLHVNRRTEAVARARELGLL